MSGTGHFRAGQMITVCLALTLSWAETYHFCHFYAGRSLYGGPALTSQGRHASTARPIHSGARSRVGDRPHLHWAHDHRMLALTLRSAGNLFCMMRPRDLPKASTTSGPTLPALSRTALLSYPLAKGRRIVSADRSARAGPGTSARWRLLCRVGTAHVSWLPGRRAYNLCVDAKRARRRVKACKVRGKVCECDAEVQA